jgi:O-antigen/teichoic acid export membrane protein
MRLAALASVGFPFALTRIVQATLLWSVPWATGVFQGPTQAGIVGTALRVAGALGAALAAVRFSTRPTLIEMNTLRRYEDLSRLLKLAGFGAATLALSGVIGAAVLGSTLLQTLFGTAFGDAKPILVLALIGLIGEGAMGLSDDFVRVSDQAGRVLTLQVALSLAFSVAAFSLAAIGPIPAMIAYVSYYFVFAFIMIRWASIELRKRRARSPSELQLAQ